MRKTNLRMAVLLAAILMNAVAASADNVKSTLKSATVFFRGAELTHSATAALKSGESEVVIEGLSPNIDLNSLKVKVSGGVMVSATEFTTDFLTEPVSSASVKRLQDSIELVNNVLNAVNVQIKLNRGGLALLQKGMESNMSLKEKSVTVADMTTQLEYYKTKALAYENAIADDTKKAEEHNKTLGRLRQQLQLEQGKRGVNNGLLKLSVVASMAVPTATFTISYFTPLAGWTPYYDINVLSVDKPIKLISRSKVSQTTGLDWTKVALTLSTATPVFNREAPLFSTWFLDFQTYKPRPVATQNTISYKMEDKSFESGYLAGETSGIKIRGAATVNQSATPLYVVDGVIFNGDISEIDPATIKSMTVLKDATATSLYGSRGASGVVLITTKTMEDYIITEEKSLNTDYAIALPYTIPGNGKEQIIDLKTYETSASYKYYCAPKLDPSVFLVAEIADWEKLNLLSGMANVTYDGTFVGQTYLNTGSTNQKLSLTLGTDKRVSVKREKLMDYSSVKNLGSETRVSLTYSITVRNNQNKAINLVLKEQYPTSAQKSITVELNTKETTTPTVNKEDTGVLTWENELAAGESREYRIAYSVRFPKGSNINL